MKAIEFPEANVKYAENQDEYQTLPAHKTEHGVVICCFELDEKELEQVKESGKIYLQLHTFNHPLQPIGLTCLNPFE